MEILNLCECDLAVKIVEFTCEFELCNGKVEINGDYLTLIVNDDDISVVCEDNELVFKADKWCLKNIKYKKGEL